jgi:muramoyltetrapeptide carboxypeptidase LdcA involved in peptidoglycan recycling
LAIVNVFARHPWRAKQIFKGDLMIKPNQLKKGDTIAIVSPSGGAVSAFPDIYQSGVQYLEDQLGLRVKEYPSVKMESKELYNNPKIRADDINEAFLDSDVKGIISSIGGSDSVRILKYLDIKNIKKNPKLIMGYSDSTSFLAYLNMKGLVTFYGSSVMAGFSYLKNFVDAGEEYEKVFFGNEKYSIRAFQGWANNYKNWADSKNIGQVEEIFYEWNEHQWINKGNVSKGKLWGGCIEILEMMNGTFAWPNMKFFKDKILFFETSEEKPTPDHVGYVLRNFGLQGILGQIKGLLIAKPKGYTKEEKNKLNEITKMVVVEEWGRSDLNIVMNMDFGHTEPRHIMPYGIEMEINAEKESICFIEKIYK